MRKLLSLFATILIVIGAEGAARPAAHAVSLTRVAASSRLLLTWLGPERAVSLTAPGLAIVVRPGQNVVEVNERIETVAQAPTYENGDIYVSPQLAAHIASLARIAAQQSAMQVAPAPALSQSEPTYTGSIAITAKPAPGVAGILVEGSAPSGAPVRITLVATLGADVPSVVISRHDLVADAQGRFQAVVPIGPDYMEGSVVRVLATSVPTVKSASAQITVGAPNAGVSIPTLPQ